MKFRTRGGKRRGAGRAPTTVRGGRVRAGVPHRRRPEHKAWQPLHVTLRMSDAVMAHARTLRRRDCYRVLRGAFVRACLRDDAHGAFRICHYSIQHNHIHLLVEAGSTIALSRGMQGFGTRVARGINRLLCRRGRVFGDRYHARALASPREVRNAIGYVLNNARRHGEHRGMTAEAARRWIDPFSSGHAFDGWQGQRTRGDVAAVSRADGREAGRSPPDEPSIATPATWLLGHGWRRHGLVAIDELPARGARR